MKAVIEEVRAIAKADTGVVNSESAPSELRERCTHGSYVEIREPVSGKLLFRVVPAGELIEIRQRDVETLVDLRRLGLRFVNLDGGFA